MWKRRQFREPVGPTAVIGFAGDTLLGYPDGRPVDIDLELIRRLGECDCVVVNQEGPLTTAPPKVTVGAVLAAPPAAAEQLKSLHVTVANVANNHMMDHGAEGLAETLDTLRRKGIRALGAGATANEAARPLILSFPFGTLAMVSWCVPCPGASANATSPGALPLDLPTAVALIARLRSEGHIVCAQYHGGEEFLLMPWPDQRRVLIELSRAGAQLTIGHHAHVFQGMQVAGDGLIAYGLGNFYFNLNSQRVLFGTDVGLFLAVEVDGRGPFAVRHLFARMDRDRRAIRLLAGPEAEAQDRLFEDLTVAMSSDLAYIRARRYECLMALVARNVVTPTRYPGRVGRVLRVGMSVLTHIRKSFTSHHERSVLAAAILALPQVLTGFGRRATWFPRRAPDGPPRAGPRTE